MVFPIGGHLNGTKVVITLLRTVKHRLLLVSVRIKLPKLGWVRLKEFGYIPTDSEHFVIKQGRIKFKAGRYYLTCLVEQGLNYPEVGLTGEPIGIDGLKNLPS